VISTLSEAPKNFMTQRELAEQIESIGELHADFFGPDESRLH